MVSIIYIVVNMIYIYKCTLLKDTYILAESAIYK